jgi:hypothetical protein
MLSLWQTGKLYLYSFTFLLLPAVGCLWVLLGGPSSSGGLLGWLAVAVAPWWLLAAGVVPLGKAGLGYALHRLHPQTDRVEKPTGNRVPSPSLLIQQALLGGGSVLLAALILWPRYLPEGALLWESTEVKSLPVADTARWEGQKVETDRAEHLVYTCIYLSFYGLVTEHHALRPQYPRPCAYFYRRSP